MQGSYSTVWVGAYEPARQSRYMGHVLHRVATQRARNGHLVGCQPGLTKPFCRNNPVPRFRLGYPYFPFASRLPYCSFGSLRRPQRALPTETKVESGTSQSKSGTSVNLSDSGKQPCAPVSVRVSVGTTLSLRLAYRGTSFIRNCPPPRTTVGP